MDRGEWAMTHVQEARNHYRGAWPAELTSGVMFWKGTRITRDEFTRGPLTSPVAPPPPAEQASGEHVEALRGLRRAVANQNWLKELDAIDAAIAALSQRPVVDAAHTCRGPGFCEACSRALGCCFQGDRCDRRECPCPAFTPQQPEKGEG